jgi:hypothetical protein
MSKRLYVGNISFKATEDDVRDLFSQAGEVVSVRLIKDVNYSRLRGWLVEWLRMKMPRRRSKTNQNVL